jgi:hypothetical protein
MVLIFTTAGETSSARSAKFGSWAWTGTLRKKKNAVTAINFFSTELSPIFML